MRIAAERRTSVRSSRGSYTSSRTSLACSAIGPRPFQGLLARLAAKIAAYTCGQHLPICSSVGHCAIWRISWFEKICISRLSLSFNHGEFRGGHKACREIPPLAFFVGSSGFLECRVTLRPA